MLRRVRGMGCTRGCAALPALESEDVHEVGLVIWLVARAETFSGPYTCAAHGVARREGRVRGAACGWRAGGQADTRMRFWMSYA